MVGVVLCERLAVGKGRNQNQTYINAMVGLRDLFGFVTLTDWINDPVNATHPWNDVLFNEFIIELTPQQFSDFEDDTVPLFSSGLFNLPRWQQQATGTGQTADFGHWTDPTDSLTLWVAGVPIADPRWIVRVYDQDPVVNPGTAVHLASEEFDEDTVTPTRGRFIRLFSANDTPNNTNAQNQRTTIGGKLMDFDFTAGVAPFNIAVNMTGKGEFPSNGEYRITGPGNETSYIWRVFGKTIEVTAGEV